METFQTAGQDRFIFTGFEVVIPNHGNIGSADAQARREVSKFLNQRERAIQMEGYIPKRKFLLFSGN